MEVGQWDSEPPHACGQDERDRMAAELLAWMQARPDRLCATNWTGDAMLVAEREDGSIIVYDCILRRYAVHPDAAPPDTKADAEKGD